MTCWTVLSPVMASTHSCNISHEDLLVDDVEGFPGTAVSSVGYLTSALTTMQLLHCTLSSPLTISNKLHCLRMQNLAYWHTHEHVMSTTLSQL